MARYGGTAQHQIRPLLEDRIEVLKNQSGGDRRPLIPDTTDTQQTHERHTTDTRQTRNRHTTDVCVCRWKRNKKKRPERRRKRRRRGRVVQKR
jgi:hypothetical protein